MSSSRSPEALSGGAYWRRAAQLTVASWREMVSPRGIPINVAAGITIALVALPLNLALAIACGLPPEIGLVTGAVAGMIGGLLGASRLQITGPEVALAPLTLQIVSTHGYQGLLVVTFMAGVIQIALGGLRLGRLVNAIPVPVIGGFMAAVGLLVFNSQLPRFLGLPSEVRLLSDVRDLSVLSQIDLQVATLGVVVLATALYLARLHRRLPGSLVALTAAVLAVAVLGVSVPTVDPIEAALPRPGWPSFGMFDVRALLPEALALAMLASIDSLLCVRAIDMRIGGERTRTDQEIVAQGMGNIICACIGGMPIAAAVVRSTTAIEAGATTRLAPIVQSILLGLVLLVLGPYASYVPLVALAAVLLIVGYRLIDLRQLVTMWRVARFEAAVFIVTAGGILLTDFVVGIAVGLGAALVHFARRQRSLLEPIVVATATASDGGGVGVRNGQRHPLAPVAGSRRSPDTGVIRLQGPLFFAAQDRIEAAIQETGAPRALVVDVSSVSTVDLSGAIALAKALKPIAEGGTRIQLRPTGDPTCDLMLQWALADSGVDGTWGAPGEPPRTSVDPWESPIPWDDRPPAASAEPGARYEEPGTASG